jgi:hypothetical protein
LVLFVRMVLAFIKAQLTRQRSRIVNDSIGLDGVWHVKFKLLQVKLSMPLRNLWLLCLSNDFRLKHCICSVASRLEIISQLYSSHLLFKRHSVCQHGEDNPDQLVSGGH